MNTEYKCVTTVDGIRDYIGGSRIVAFDFETAPDDPYREEDKAALDPARARIVGCSFSVKEGTGIYVPVDHRVGTNIERDAFFTFLTAFLMNNGSVRRSMPSGRRSRNFLFPHGKLSARFSRRPYPMPGIPLCPSFRASRHGGAVCGSPWETFSATSGRT